MYIPTFESIEVSLVPQVRPKTPIPVPPHLVLVAPTLDLVDAQTCIHRVYIGYSIRCIYSTIAPTLDLVDAQTCII